MKRYDHTDKETIVTSLSRLIHNFITFHKTNAAKNLTDKQLNMLALP